jgi:hypothetical protein
VNSDSVTATADELQATLVNRSLNPPVGSKYGFRWVRVVDPNCRQVVSPPSERFNFFVAPPTFTLTPTAVRCHGDSNGSIRVNITPADPAISSFVVNVFNSESSTITRDQVWQDTTSILIESRPGFTYPAGTYWVSVQNNTKTDILGSCTSDRRSVIIDTPAPVTGTIQAQPVSCFGGDNGGATVHPTGGVGGYGAYEWQRRSDGTVIARDTPTISGLTAGRYTVSFTDGHNCRADTTNTTINITQPSALTVTISATERVHGFQVSCDGKPDGHITATASGGTKGTVGEGYSYQWTNGPQSATYSGLAAGTYTVTATDANGCQAQEFITLTAKPTPNFVFSNIVHNTCPGQSEGSFFVPSPSHLEGSAIFNLSPAGDTRVSNNTLTASNLRSGAYTVTVTDNRGEQCATSNQVIVSEPAGYSVSLSAPTPHNGRAISCSGATDGSLTAVVTNNATGQPTTANINLYTWFEIPNETTSIASGPATTSISNRGEGTYRVVVRYNTQCETSASLFLDAPEPVSPGISITSNYNGLPISCRGRADGELTASASGGTGAFEYRWNGAFAATGPVLTHIGAGTHTVTATDMNGCRGTVSFTLLDPIAVSAAISVESRYNGFDIRCSGDSSGHLRATGSGGTGSALGYSFEWSTGAQGADLTGLRAGTYSVTVTDANGCVASATREITEPTPVTAEIAVRSNFNGQPISCHGAANGQLEAGGSGGASGFLYRWSTGATGAVLSGLRAGAYTVTATDANGCSTVAHRTIDDPDPVAVDSIRQSDYRGFGVSCAGASDGYLIASASGGTGAIDYDWINTTERTRTLSAVGAGTFTVRATDANGCVAEETRTLTQPAAVTLSLLSDRDIACFNGSDGQIQVAAAGGVAGYEYSADGLTWLPDATFSNLTARSYTLHVRDANRCSASLTNTLTQPPPLVIGFTDIEPAYCADPRGRTRAVVSGGVGSYVLEWRDSVNRVFDTDELIEHLSPGVYTLSVSDGNRCTLSRPIGIVSADGPVVSITETVAPLCSYSADGRITLAATGNGPFTYRWPGGQTGATLVGAAQGTYIATVRDVNGCETTQSATLTAPPALAVRLLESVNPACFGDANGSLNVAGEGGTPDYTFGWGTRTGASISGLAEGTYTVTLTDANACTTRETFTLRQPEPLRLNLADRVLPRCFGACNGLLQVAALGGNGQYQYTWANGTQNETAQQLCAGNYMVTATDRRGCTVSQTYALGQPPALQLRLLENRPPDCHNGCNGRLQVDAVGGTGMARWLWSNGAAVPAINNLCAGGYSVTATDENACTVSASYTLRNPDKLEVYLGDGVTLCVGQTHVLDAGPQWVSYVWSSNTGFTSTQQRVVIREAGRYHVAVRNALGCEAGGEFLLETSRNLLTASFLMPAEAFVADTIAFIDVSWPLPESATWQFPPEMKKLINLGDVVFGQFNRSGTYTVTLTTALGECRDVVGKNIRIVPSAEPVTGGRLGYREMVNHFGVYPNPSAGMFQVLVDLAETAPIALSVWNPVTGRMVATHRASDNRVYDLSFDLAHAGPGTYVLRLDYGAGSRYIRFLIIR